MRSGTRLQPVEEMPQTEVAQSLIGQEPERAPRQHEPPPRPRVESAMTSLLLMSLRALSQRTIVALASLVDLALLSSVFAALLLIIGKPTTPQLVAIAGYAIFVLISVWIRRGTA
jgi:hypothetical protein